MGQLQNLWLISAILGLMNQTLIPILRELEQFCQEQGIDHRFVGGVSFGGLLNDKTICKIDIPNRTMYLKDYNPPFLMRLDGTLRDIDIILFEKDKKKIQLLKDFVEKLRKTYLPFPLISIEATIYPSLGRRNPALQFVTAYEVDSDNHLHLAFDVIIYPISWRSVEAWTLVLDNKVKLTVRNPIADFYAYSFRSPSGIKPKDKSKVEQLKSLCQAVYAEGAKHHINYYSKEYYKPWQHFTEEIEKSAKLRIKLKRFILGLYWSTIGTWFAHGRGVSKVTSGLANQFTGIRQ